MTTSVSLAVFLFGAVIASFIGVVAGRLGTGESIATGRSRCDACGRVLHPRSLIPVFSFFIQKGRARCCGARLSVLDPLSELALGLLFAYSYGHIGLSPELGCFWVGLALLLLLVRYDLAHQILPPVPLACLIVTGGILSALTAASFEEWRATAGVAVALSLVLATIYFVSRGRALGFSDIPLVLGLGLLFPSVAFSGFVFSFWIGALIGIVILARRPKGSRIGVEVPFAPFLAAGFVLAYITQWDPFAIIAAIL